MKKGSAFYENLRLRLRGDKPYIVRIMPQHTGCELPHCIPPRQLAAARMFQNVDVDRMIVFWPPYDYGRHVAEKIEADVTKELVRRECVS